MCNSAVSLNDQRELCYGMLCYHGNRSFSGFARGFSLQWPFCQISCVTHSLYCENSWKTGWESDRKRVSGRLCWPQAQRDSIIWSAWVGEGCVPGPSVISERNSMFETGRSVVTLPPTHTLHRTPLFNISDRSETSVELSWWVHPYFTRVSWRIINAPLEWSGDYEDFFLCLFLSCKICFILIFLTVLCFCVYLIIKC